MQYYATGKETVANITFWGLIASPFQLKMQALADYAGLAWQRWPDQAATLEAFRTAFRLAGARRREEVERYPGRDANLDEYPAVPYYTLDGRQFFYDSSGLALHLDALDSPGGPLLPQDPALRFLCRLIDEAFDEFGLYMAHHNRWVTSAATNIMGEMTVRELRRLVPPMLRSRLARRLAQRQVRRCPYLFSVAPDGYRCDMPAALTPPCRAGFPPTHDLLDHAWRNYLRAMETVLARQPFLLGQRFTLADASAYGQLGMNLVDGRAADLMRECAPLTYRWLDGIRQGAHRGSAGELHLSEALLPLVRCVGETFVPLMQQNEAAYREASARGQALFNEAAFDRGEALYDGSLLDMPYRSVVKSFQVGVWRDLRDAWRGMRAGDRERLLAYYPPLADAMH